VISPLQFRLAALQTLAAVQKVGKEGSERTLAACVPKVCYADKAALCTCGYCWRSISSHLQRRLLGSAAHFTKPAVRTRRSRQISDGSSLRLVPTIKTWTFLLLARPQAV